MMHRDDWLWDGSGEPDPGARRLTRALGTLAEPSPPPRWPDQRPSRPWWPVLVPAMAAAGLVALAAGAWFVAARSAWPVEALSGAPEFGGWARPWARLAPGADLVTGVGTRARLAIADIGWLRIEPGTRLRLLETRPGHHRLSLQRGEVEAFVVAPARAFVVETPAGTATDLGCAYRLRTDASGDGELVVTSGWVAFTHRGRESFVPAGARCPTRAGAGPGTPRFAGAPPSLESALDTIDASPAPGIGPGAVLDTALAAARVRDAMTLWHLLRRVRADARPEVARRLAALAPPPAGVTVEGAVRLEPRALDAWWDSFGFGSSSLMRAWEAPWGRGSKSRPGR